MPSPYCRPHRVRSHSVVPQLQSPAIVNVNTCNSYSRLSTRVRRIGVFYFLSLAPRGTLYPNPKQHIEKAKSKARATEIPMRLIETREILSFEMAIRLP